MQDFLDDDFFLDFEEKAMKLRQRRLNEIKHRKIPAKRTLLNSLSTLTKERLDDIVYNLGIEEKVPGAKAAVAKMLEGKIQLFFKGYVTSLILDQKALFDHLAERGGITTEINVEDERLDILVGLGILNCGKDKNGVQVYMPDEILAAYQEINNQEFDALVRQNDEVLRIAAGCTYFYGFIDYDSLYQKIIALVFDGEKKLEFIDFMGVMLNGGTWIQGVYNDERGLCSQYLVELKDIVAAQEKFAQEISPDLAEFSYETLYDAGDKDYLHTSPEFQALSQYLMQEYEHDIIAVGEDMKTCYALLQNFEELDDIQETIEDQFGEVKDGKQFAKLLQDYQKVIPQWRLNGHTLEEAKALKGKK